MTFTLHSLNRSYDSTECFFGLHSGSATFYSPYYKDQKAAFKAMEDLVIKLRNEPDITESILEEADTFSVKLFGKVTRVAGASTNFPSKKDAWQAINDLHQAAQKRTFKLSFLELAEQVAQDGKAEKEEIKNISDLELITEERPYSWNEMGSSILRVDKAGVLPISPALGMQFGLNRGPCDPIFNVFQPYVAADLPLYKGRQQEVDDFYGLVHEHKLLLLYGIPGVGKSSLILCGLANKMEVVPGELVLTHRIASGILPGFRQTLQQTLQQLDQTEALAETTDLELLIGQVQERVGKSLLLVFDQLEDLFQPAVSEIERREFFNFIQQLDQNEDIPCTIILVLREEYLAPLADYEEQLPVLLDNRYRLQPLKKDSMMNLTVNMLDILKFQDKIDVEEPEIISEKICEQLVNENGDVPFQCLQIYLHEMHQSTCADAKGAPPLFNSGLVDELGPAREVIDNHIGKRIASLQEQIEDGVPNPAIQRQIDELNQSRQQCGCPDNKAVIAAAAIAPVAAVATKKVRNLRWLLLLALLALLLSLLGYWLFFNWLQKQDDPCVIAQTEDTCEAYINYLLKYGEEANCAAEFRSLLTERGCDVWTDYQVIQQTSTCGTYQDFFNKYRNSKVSTDYIREMLMEWECPIIRDTVQITLRDTVFDNRPRSANKIGSRIGTPSSSPPCKDIGGESFKRIGPLWMMTDALDGGPYSWEDALDACKAKGWRLPCIGEVDFLIDNIYRGQGTRAYQNLAGSGKCYLVNPTEVINKRIDFWTGTEANDAQAWTFYFDTSTKSIGRESNIQKSRKLPCLCVKKDDNNGVSGIPPCYNKNIDRRPG